MKVVYTYINPWTPSTLGIEHFFPGILSAFKAIELYGNATLYTLKGNIDRLKKFNLPFTDYVELELPKIKHSIPPLAKLQTYCKQKEPFIHLDLDFVLNSKYNLETNENTPIKFGHKDKPGTIHFEHIKGTYLGYLKPGYDLGKKYGFSTFSELILDEIPNMGIVVCSNPDIFKLATEKTLNIYRENLDYFNLDTTSEVFLEQGLIHMFLKQMSGKYSESVHSGTNFIYNLDNLLFTYKKENRIEVPEPLSHSTLYFKNEKDLINNFNLNKYYSCHFLGLSKTSYLSQSLILKNLSNYMSQTEILNFEKEFDTGGRNFFKQYLELECLSNHSKIY